MRAPGAATGVYALECAMDELAVALKLDPVELRLRCYSDRDQNEDIPYTSKQLRECYRQGAAAFGWDKRNARAALDARRQGSGRLGHGHRRLGGAADADGGPHRADRQRPCRGFLRHLRHRHRHLHDHGAGRGRYARPADRQRHGQARRLRRCRVARRGRLMDRGLGGARDRSGGRRVRERVAAARARRCRTRRSRTSSRTMSCSPTA